VIETRGLTRRFRVKGSEKDLTAVDAIDLSIRRGEIFGLLGPNGAGKTTTINMLVTILKPTEGVGLVAGRDVAREPTLVRKTVGIVFQEPSIDTILTARENLELHARLYGVPKAERAKRIREMLALVGLTERADTLVKQFSGGMKRRLEIARGLLHRPAVLFLDEPTLGLDPQTREHIWAYVRRLRDEYGTTIVLTTHYMGEADALCDRIGIIDHGRIIALGTPRELKATLRGDLVRLRFAAPPDAGRFKGLAAVEKVEVRGNEAALTVRDAAANLPRVLAAAGEVESVEVHRPTLEDVFIALTGREIRDDTTEGEAFSDAIMRSATGGSNR